MVVATSGTYAFQPTIADIISEGFERCGLDPANLTARHIVSAIRSMNLLFVELENVSDQPWRQDRISTTLIADQAGLVLPAGTLAVLSVVMQRGTEPTARRAQLTLITDTDWEQLSQQTDTGFPSQYFVARALPGETSYIDDAIVAGAAPAWGPSTTISGYASDRPLLVWWPGSDTAGDVVTYIRVRQTQDATSLNENPDAPRQWLEVLFSGMAAKMALKWAPERYKGLMADYVQAVGIASRGARDRSSIVFGMRGIGSAGRRRRC